MAKQLRYVLLWLSLCKNSVIRQTEFKANFVGRLFIEVVWIFAQILFFKSALRFVPALAGWTEGEIWFFVASLFFVDGMMMVFAHDNQSNFGQMIRLGQFDFYLLYPVSSLFLANFRFVNAISLINIAMSLSLAIWASRLPGMHVAWLVWALYISLGSAMVVLLGVLLCSVSFWSTQSTNIVWLFYEVYRLGHRPDALYSPWLRRLLRTVFPAAFFISVPVQLAVGHLRGWWYVYPFAIVLVLALLCNWVWKRGVGVFEGVMG